MSRFFVRSILSTTNDRVILKFVNGLLCTYRNNISHQEILFTVYPTIGSFEKYSSKGI